MVKRMAMLTVVLAAITVVAAAAVWWYRAENDAGTVPPATAPSPYRVVSVWEGNVAVFLPDADTPEEVFDTPTAVLPAAERKRLEAGVAVADAEALRRLLEDYLS